MFYAFQEKLIGSKLAKLVLKPELIQTKWVL